ncbi:MAG: C40 family peptidase [Firmicutes bacterium]|nr:C40 family peptidase [Bacillota bacterium]
MHKKIICLFAAVIAAGSMVYADDTILFTSRPYEDKVEVEESGGNVTYAHGVTGEMAQASYWGGKLGKYADRVLMTADEITKLNAAMLAEPETYMYDLENIEETYYASPVKREIPTGNFYINGEKIDNEKYFGKLSAAIVETGYKGETKTQYAVITKRANMKDWPEEDIIGYSANDTDDEMQTSSMNVNEPFVIRQKCEIDGKTFYNGYSTNCAGWIPADCVGICSSKEEWLDAWKVDVDSKDILVVTQDKIILEPTVFVPEISEVKLMIGTVLKLVPENDMPASIGDRGTWNNYVVYLPTRDENGKYVRQYALISQHYNVSIGYLPLTQKNVLDTAFTCLGNRYGWGGMLDSMDCSAYTRQVYRCFGLEIPRNTTWQVQIPDHVSDLSAMTDEQKLEFFDTIPVGSLLMFRGHITIYLGKENGMAYVISDTGSVAEIDGELKVLSPMSVIINPLDVRRGNGTTWLNNMIYAVTFGEAKEKVLYGDADNDKKITAADAAAIMQKTLTENYKMPVESTDNWLEYIDVDKDTNITAADAAAVLQSVVSENYTLPIA